MHYMLRSTDPAGRAVIAASQQSEAAAQAVLRRLRESTFLFGRPPGEQTEIIESVVGVPDLDLGRFVADLATEEVADAYQSDWDETRRPNEFVRTLVGDWMGIGNLKHSEGHDRYAFPTLIFRGPGGDYTAPGWVDYEEYETAMESAAPGSTAHPRADPTPQEAFARWPTLTEVELVTLCGEHAEPPADVVSYDWGEGVVWMTDAEATARQITTQEGAVP